MDSEDHPIYIPAFMRRPGRDIPIEEAEKDGHIALPGDLDGEDLLALELWYKKYKETSNPVYALEAYLVAHKAGLYPPEWVLDWLESGLAKYSDGLGMEQLEKCLGFPKGRGQTPAYKSVHLEQRDGMVLLDVYRLRVLLGLSIDEAAKCVASQLKLEDWDDTGLNLGDISWETIADKYQRGFGKTLETDDDKMFSPSKWCKSEKENFLSRFDLEYCPPPKDEIARILSLPWR